MTTEPRRPWLGRRLLEGAILLYRRRVSGRGPLRRVTCTFGRCESCSAYGLRIVRNHARSLPHALRLIVDRIRRCRSSSVYRSHRALLWGEDYDRLDHVDHAAAQAHEQPQTRGALLLAAIGLARYRGQRRTLARLRERLRSLPIPRRNAPRLPLRDGRRLPEHLRRRWWRRLAGPVLLGGLALALPLPLALVVGGLMATAIALGTRRFLAERRRLQEQQRLARFALA